VYGNHRSLGDFGEIARGDLPIHLEDVQHLHRPDYVSKGMLRILWLKKMQT